MTNDTDDWFWRAYLTHQEDDALQAGMLSQRQKRRIAAEIAQEIGVSAEEILAAMQPTEDQQIAAAIELINKLLAEPTSPKTEPPATYDRDRSGHRRSIRR